MSTARLTTLRARFADLKLDGMLVSSVPNRHYLSGFSGTLCHLLVDGSRQLLATDSRYTEQAASESEGWDIRDITLLNNWLNQFVTELGIKRLGYEADHVTVAEHTRLKRTLAETGCELIATNGVVAEMRITKSADEAANLARAAQIGDAALAAATRDLKVGVTEVELAIRFLIAARELGASDISFPTIVAFGPNAARPHHQPTDRPLAEGDMIVFDCGVVYNGYCSDLTRTLAFGEPSDKLREVYNIVWEAQAAGLAAVRAGIAGRDADAVARDLIEQHGYGERFGHGLGHGVGMEIHELPYLARTGKLELAASAVVTVEPGIYIPGWGGVRIEDMVLVEERGHRPLSNAPKPKL